MALAADPSALKIIVADDGPVALSGADLAAAGWSLAALDPDQLTLAAGGQWHALELIGCEDGRLDPLDRLLFHGRAMRSEYSRENVYWLTAEGPALRFASRLTRGQSDVPRARWHWVRDHFELDTVYYLSMDHRLGDDRWMWGNALAASDRTTYTLTVGSLADGSQVPARLHMGLQGSSDDPLVSPDHHARLWLNGKLVGDLLFDGYGASVGSFDLPPGSLQSGVNSLSLANLVVPDAVVSRFFLNWIEAEYAASFRAVHNRLRFAAAGDGLVEYELTGFSRPDVVVDDVTDPARPVRLLGVQRTVAADGKFGVSFVDDAASNSTYEAYVTAEARPPARLVLNTPSDWRSVHHGADYIVIAHPLFLGALRPLVVHRARQGLRVVTVNIDDVYDEFAHGVFDPRAIRELLRYAATSWRPPRPTYVLLVGEANLDYRGAYGVGPPNFVPAMQIDLDAGPAGCSDVWFASLDEDPLPDLLLGRLSVASVEEARTVVDKILAYEQLPSHAAWRRTALLVADDEAPFEPLAEEWANLLAPTWHVRRFYAARTPREHDLTASIARAVEEGAALVAYAGHGNVDTWGPWHGGGRIFQNGDIQRLANGERLPILIAASCMNAWLNHPHRPVALAELWLKKSGGGGIAAWASSGMDSLAYQRQLLEPFLSGLAEGRYPTLGELTLHAMTEAWSGGPHLADTLRQFVLLGDPALLIGEPPEPPHGRAGPPEPSPVLFLPYGARGAP